MVKTYKKMKKDIDKIGIVTHNQFIEHEENFFYFSKEEKE